MKKVTMIAAVLIAAIGFTGCTEDEKGGNPGIEQGLSEITINFDQNKTRATDEEGDSDNGTEEGVGDENAVAVIEFFTFDGTTPDTETPYYRKETTNLDPVTFKVNAGEKVFLVAVNANIFDDANGYKAEAAGNVTYDKIKAKIADLLLTGDNSRATPGKGEYVMATEGTQRVNPGDPNKVKMTLHRVLSKVNAPVGTGTGVGPTLAADLDMLQQIWGDEITAADQVKNLTWTFEGYVVINGINMSYDFRYTNWTGWNTPTGANWNKTKYNDDGSVIQSVYGGSGTGDQFLLPTEGKPVFIYENKPDKNETNPGEATTFVPDQVTAFLIKGVFHANLKGSSEVAESAARYWRVNMLRADTWEIYRNSVYKVTLKTVNTPGFDTPKKGEDDGPIVDPNENTITIELEIANWTIRTEDVEF